MISLYTAEITFPYLLRITSSLYKGGVRPLPVYGRDRYSLSTCGIAFSCIHQGLLLLLYGRGYYFSYAGGIAPLI